MWVRGRHQREILGVTYEGAFSDAGGGCGIEQTIVARPPLAKAIRGRALAGKLKLEIK
jgi:hypothetical protein